MAYVYGSVTPVEGGGSLTKVIASLDVPVGTYYSSLDKLPSPLPMVVAPEYSVVYRFYHVPKNLSVANYDNEPNNQYWPKHKR